MQTINELLDHLPSAAKVVMDSLSLATVLTTIAQILPPLAALLSIIWYVLRIYDWVREKTRGGNDNLK